MANFDKTIDRSKTCSYRWNVRGKELPLNIADMDFKVFPAIKKAIAKRAEQDCYGYTFVPDKYYEAYIHWWMYRHHVILQKEWFCFSNSVVGSIDSIFKSLLKEKDEVIMFTPIYNVFFNCIKNNHLVLKECELILNNKKYEIDWDKLEELLKNKNAKVFLFCNPHNPVGRGFSEGEINKIVNLCKDNNVYFISDEIHADIDYNHEPYVCSYGTTARDYDKSILLLSPGKVFNVAGLHSSVVVISNKELREKVQEGLHRDDIGEPNYFAIDPVIAAFEEGLDYVEHLNDYLLENKRFVCEFFSKRLPNLYIVGGEYTYLLWIDISNYYEDSKKFVDDLQAQTGLILAPGINYGHSGEGYVRINIATPRKNVIDACERLYDFLMDLGE